VDAFEVPPAPATYAVREAVDQMPEFLKSAFKPKYA
jgi:hypothetical protein